MKIEDKMYVGLKIGVCLCVCLCLGSTAMVFGQPISRGDLLKRERGIDNRAESISASSGQH